MQRRGFLKLGTGAALSGALAACGDGGSASSAAAPATLALAANAPPQAVLLWNQAALQAIRVTKPGPPMAARSLAVVHTAMYEAWAAYDSLALGTRVATFLRRPAAERTAANKMRAVNFAAYAALVDQFPSQTAAFDAQLSALGITNTGQQFDLYSPQGIGVQAAAAIIGAAHGDGSNQLGEMAASHVPYADYTAYVSKNPPALVFQPTSISQIPAPSNWQPLTYVDASGSLKTPGFLGAHWNKVKPFALSWAGQFRPAAPALFGSDEYRTQAQHVIDVQAGLTEQQKVIAEYWADGPNSELPPGHWCLLAQYVSARDKHSDDDDVKMFFALANAVFDAGIAAWDAKRVYDSERPITAIRYLMQGKTIVGYGLAGPASGLKQIPGETWTPYQPMTFPTPPFPEHVSGHSTYSAAAAEVLKRFTGNDLFGASYIKKASSMRIDPSLPVQDLTLVWDTFTAAADQAGLSRIYGGIHFDNANLAGQTIGRQVGGQAFTKAQRYWLGIFQP